MPDTKKDTISQPSEASRCSTLSQDDASYVTDEDVIAIIDAAYTQPGPGDPLRRIVNGIVEREIEKVLDGVHRAIQGGESQ